MGYHETLVPCCVTLYDRQAKKKIKEASGTRGSHMQRTGQMALSDAISKPITISSLGSRLSKLPATSSSYSAAHIATENKAFLDVRTVTDADTYSQRFCISVGHIWLFYQFPICDMNPWILKWSGKPRNRPRARKVMGRMLRWLALYEAGSALQPTGKSACLCGTL
jgi:hypothetical protein